MAKREHIGPCEGYVCCSLGEVMDNLTGEVIGLGHYTMLSLSKCPCNRAYQDVSCDAHASNEGGFIGRLRHFEFMLMLSGIRIHTVQRCMARCNGTEHERL
jgi:hypothetical protein